MFLFARVALAAEPITMTEVLPSPPDAVRAALAEAMAAGPMAPDVLSLEVLARGRCDTLRATVGSRWAPMSYVYERCPTATGWREALVQSDAFDAYEITWELLPDAAGTRVSYTVHVEPRLPLPDGYVASRTRASMKTVLATLAARLAR
ncbi:MAG: SRPBCC family protein [Myxococcota bacterium]